MTTPANSEIFSDAHHPAEKYCEWWYFTFFYGQGDMIAGIFKIENKVPEVWVFVKETKRDPIYIRRKFPLTSFSAAQDHCNVEIGKNYFREKSGCYEIKINLGKVEIEVTFKSTFAWPDNIIERDLGGGERVRWIVPCVKGYFYGKLNISGECCKFAGLAFHDHVWHNINSFKMLRYFKNWFWGINYSPDGFFLYASVDLGKRKKFKFVFSGEGSNRLKLIDDPELQIKKTKKMSEVEIDYQGKVLNKINIFAKEPIYQWGENGLIKFFVHKLLGLSQYHCLGKEETRPDNWNYLEILEKR
jgi:hypothetical protein